MSRLPISADSDPLGRVYPVAVLGEAGIGAHGAKNGGAGDLDSFGLLDEGIEDGVESGFAQGSETGCSGVAVESHPMRQGIYSNDLLGAAPVEVVEVNHGAIFVVADGAFAGVAGDVGLGNPAAAPAENFVKLHVANSLVARPPDCSGAGCLNGPDS